MGSKKRELYSVPESTGSNSVAFTRSDTFALAVSSSLPMNTWTLRPLRLSVGRSSAKILLNAFTILAPGASF
jgi:hypothetical protein